MEKIYKIIDLPKSCFVNRIIPINKLHSHYLLDEKDKIIIKNYIKEIKIMYSLNYKLLNVRKYVDKYLDYSEIQIFQIEISNSLAIYDISRIIGKTIPYPVIIIFVKDEKIKIGSYKLRENIKNQNKNVIEELFFTGWFKKGKISFKFNKILNEIKYENLNKINIYELHNSMHNIVFENHSQYIELSKIINIFERFKFDVDFKKIKSHILNNCEVILFNENIINRIDWYKKDKMKKYNKIDLREYDYKICRDELWDLLNQDELFKKEFKKENCKSINELEDKYKKLLIKEKYFQKLKRKNYCSDCEYYYYNKCLNSLSEFYNSKCNNINCCFLFKKYKENNINKYIEQKQNFLKYNNNILIPKLENLNLEVVEYGDIIKVVDLHYYNVRKFLVVECNRKIPKIQFMCINKKIGYRFVFNNTIYKLIKILKNNKGEFNV